MEKVIRREPYFENHWVNCACGGANHVLHFKLHLPDGTPGDDPCLYLELVTPPQPGFWKRVWSAIKGNDCHYLGWDSVYDGDTAREHLMILDRFITEWDKYHGEKK